MSNPSIHTKLTSKLARKLSKKDIYNWLLTDGYFPESYVLPPCFVVEKFPPYGTVYCKAANKGKTYSPKTSVLAQIQFPKSNYADRIFSIIQPELYCDIAYEIASNW